MRTPSVSVVAGCLLLVVAGVAGVSAPAAADAFVTMTSDVSTEDPVPDEAFTVTTTLANDDDSDDTYRITDLSVAEVPDRNYDEDDEELAVLDVSDSLGPDTERTYDFSVTLEDSGEQTVYVHATLLGPRAERKHIVQPVTVDVDRPNPQLELDVSDAVVGAERTMNVTVANGLNASVSQIDVRVDSPADALTFRTSSRVRATLAGGDTAGFTFPVKATEAGQFPVEVTLTYTLDEDRRTVTRTFDADFTEPQNPGEIRLTGVSVTRGPGGVLQVAGTAANVGSTDVDSVIVSVVDGDGVRGADPQPDYFVGGVEGSDFASFDLNAELTGDRTTVPVRVEYVVDDVRRSYTTDVRVSQSMLATPTPAPQGGPLGGLPLLPAAVAALVVVLGGALVLRR
ncbi:hypothetical protein [Halobaculum magnesiiphilum]|uniref:CARDB domain-containing protein n=1 Tax=Halobaculum magnesiiphilum TaxID=1017351 RepID=A0A8T8W9E0_9EURY|nr:hypothetical protein [Halobaculum magnesiiphilum]QZP36441.1 hypothetical protein K6T50_08850 [Halobaculum magnesiiphilum]